MSTKDKSTLIRARLILAQQLLEESDTLPGLNGYKFSDSDDPFFHVRHEREALVVYLLLTCFDLLGQSDSRPHVDFMQWLTSKDPALIEDRKIATKELSSDAQDSVGRTRELFEYYNKTYGATKAFTSGIDQLPDSAKVQLLSSVSVENRHPDSLKPENKNTSFCGIPLYSEIKELKLQKDYLYSIRNQFTHKLSQRHSSSVPMMSNFLNSILPEGDRMEIGACWGIYVFDGKAYYGGVHQEQTHKYVYTLKDWPFALFEVLYSALGEKFDRTTIKLKFYIQSEDGRFSPSIDHARLQEVLEKEYGVPK